MCCFGRLPWPMARRSWENVDHCCKVGEMAALFIQLAKSDPAFPTAEADRILAIENRIALGAPTPPDWECLEASSRYCGLTCPECRSSLFELPDKKFLRFRCRAGHAFSPQSLVYAQADARDSTLSSVRPFARGPGCVTRLHRLRARQMTHSRPPQPSWHSAAAPS
jgi:two-component system, chemotaxis family, protein-glutamate methylesterase/glutaminase